VTVVLKRPGASPRSLFSLQKNDRLWKKKKGIKSRNKYFQWLQESKEEKKNEAE